MSQPATQRPDRSNTASPPAKPSRPPYVGQGRIARERERIRKTVQRRMDRPSKSKIAEVCEAVAIYGPRPRDRAPLPQPCMGVGCAAFAVRGSRYCGECQAKHAPSPTPPPTRHACETAGCTSKTEPGDRFCKRCASVLLDRAREAGALTPAPVPTVLPEPVKRRRRRDSKGGGRRRAGPASYEPAAGCKPARMWLSTMFNRYPEQVAAVYDRMTTRQRDVFVDYYAREQRQADIAERRGMSAAGVSDMLARVRRYFREADLPEPKSTRQSRGSRDTSQMDDRLVAAIARGDFSAYFHDPSVGQAMRDANQSIAHAIKEAGRDAGRADQNPRNSLIKSH